MQEKQECPIPDSRPDQVIGRWSGDVSSSRRFLEAVLHEALTPSMAADKPRPAR